MEALLTTLILFVNNSISISCNTEIETSIYTFPMLTSIHQHQVGHNSPENSYDGGLDEIPSSFVKCGSTEFPLFCLKLFNLSMEYGTYPSVWKTSLITPRFGTRKRRDIANYRSINLTSMLSKTMEKIIRKRLLPFLQCLTRNSSSKTFSI